MSAACVYHGTHATGAMKLEVEHHSCGTSSPSTSGGRQGYTCPSFQQEYCSPSTAGWMQISADMSDYQEVMGRYAMCMNAKGLLGEGSFSICRRGIDLKTGEAVAIKVYKVPQGSNSSGATRERFMRQVKVLWKLQEEFEPLATSELWQSYVTSQKPSDFFVQLLDYSRDDAGLPGPDPFDGVFYVVTELAHTSLKDYLRTQRAQGHCLPREAVRCLSRSVVLAAAALHAKGFVHLDLKPENLMVFNGRLKIIDVDGCVEIGSVISLEESSSSFSPCYCAPEWARFLQAGGQLVIVADPSLDAWSVGLTLCECATLTAVLRPAFAYFLKSVGSVAEAHAVFIDWLASLETSPVPECVQHFDAELGGFLSHGLLACDPDLRSTPAQCLSSQYLSPA